MEDALEKAQAESLNFRDQLNAALRTPGSAANPKMVLRPKGTAGTHFSIQEEMGLSGGGKEYDIYKGIQVCRQNI